MKFDYTRNLVPPIYISRAPPPHELDQKPDDPAVEKERLRLCNAYQRNVYTVRYHSLKASKEVFPYSNAQSSGVTIGLYTRAPVYRDKATRCYTRFIVIGSNSSTRHGTTNQHTFIRIQKIKVTTTSFTLY